MGVYLVVGGSSGIGLEIVKQLTDAGHEVLAAGRTQTDDLQATGARFTEWDATTTDTIPNLPEQLHGVVYCPGTINLKPFHRLKAADFQHDLEVNYLGAVKAVQQAIPSLKKADSSSVVLFSTTVVQTGMPFHASIAGAKGAIEGLTRSLAAEYAGNSIRFNAIAPSLTDTKLAEHLLSTEAKREAGAKRHPLKKVGDPKEIAATAVFLLSDNASWMTGQIIKVDGGIGSTSVL